jgi:uncharacterized protein YjeT (DUF2065 family)
MSELWHELWLAFCLVLVIEGVIPFLYPQRWRSMVSQLGTMSDHTLRTFGLVSMLLGTVLLVFSR